MTRWTRQYSIDIPFFQKRALITPSLPHFLTHSLPPSLTHSLTHAFTTLTAKGTSTLSMTSGPGDNRGGRTFLASRPLTFHKWGNSARQGREKWPCGERVDIFDHNFPNRAFGHWTVRGGSLYVISSKGHGNPSSIHPDQHRQFYRHSAYVFNNLLKEARSLQWAIPIPLTRLMHLYAVERRH